MLHGLVTQARQLFEDARCSRRVQNGVRPHPPMRTPPCAALQRVLLTDGVGNTLFEQFRAHRQGSRRGEETGWLLLGIRDGREAVALATLPAGGRCDAGTSHVRFNSTAQAVAARVLRQADRRLTILGVVHTHPGSLRHPSDADLRGDRAWVGRLRGREGVFAIGTADAPHDHKQRCFCWQPRPNVHCLGELRFSWYSLRDGEAHYRPLPVSCTLGPDLARDLHLGWGTLEEHAERIERLMAQQANLRVEVADGALVLKLPVAGSERGLRVLLAGSRVTYYLERADGELTAVDPGEPRVDRGVYLLLAELAAD